MRYRQHVILTVDVDDENFVEHNWPSHFPWEQMLKEYLSVHDHLAVHASSVEPDILDRGYLDRDGPEDGYGYGYTPGHWRYMVAEPEPVPYYVNVYEVGQGYGGPEEGGWWFSTGQPVNDACCTEETLERAELVAEKLRDAYPSTRNQYSVLGGEDYSVLIEDHPPRGWPDVRPRYC